MSTNRTLILLLDADDHTYNVIYRRLLIHVILKFGEQLRNHFKEVESNSTLLINDILYFINSVNVDHLTIRTNTLVPPIFTPAVDFKSAFKQALSQTCPEFISYLNKLDPAIMFNIFLRANEKHTRKINSRKSHYDQIVLMSGSSRQSFGLELTGALQNGTGIFCTDLEMYADYLNVKLDRFLLSDVIGNLPIGESFKRITSENLQLVCETKETDYEHINIDCDINKTLLLMAIAHYIKITYQNPDVELHDDMAPILKTLARTFHSSYVSDLLPPLNIDLIHYDPHTNTRTPIERITGTGRIEPNYAYYVNEIMKQSPKGLIKGIDPANHLNLRKFLQTTYDPFFANRLVFSAFYFLNVLPSPNPGNPPPRPF